MALNFPDSPTLNQVYTDTTSGFSYQWDGVVWKSYASASSSNITILDDISASFNGSTTIFNLTASGIAVAPANSQQLRVVLGGIIQEPGTDYYVASSTIVFTTAPAAGLDCSIVSLGPAVPMGVPGDGTVTPQKLSTGGPSWNTGGDLNISGVVTSTNFVGNLTGNATGLSGSPNVIVGVLTATAVYSNGQELLRGVGIATAGGTVGTGATIIDFRGAGISTVTVSAGVATVNITGGGGGSTSTASGDGSAFNTGITSALSAILTGIGDTVLTLPSTAGKEYLIYSIHTANVGLNTEVNVIAAFDFNGGERSYFAYNIPIPTGMAVELLSQPQILNPSDKIVMRSTDYDRVGVDSSVQVYITYEEKTSTEYFGLGFGPSVGITTTAAVGIYTATTNPAILQSIRLTNTTDLGGYPISVTVTSGVTTRSLVEDLIVPKYASVELLETPKRLNVNDVLKIQVDQLSTIDVQISGKVKTA